MLTVLDFSLLFILPHAEQLRSHMGLFHQSYSYGPSIMPLITFHLRLPPVLFFSCDCLIYDTNGEIIIK